MTTKMRPIRSTIALEAAKALRSVPLSAQALEPGQSTFRVERILSFRLAPK